MGRPPLPLGTWGKIRTYQVGEKSWRAIANYKDFDGITRPVECMGPTETRAANRLRERLRDRVRRSGHGEKGTAFEGLHTHDFRHYVAGKLDDAGLSAREIADYLGHERISTTQEDYMERGVVGESAAPALDDRPKIEPPKDMG